MLDQINIPEIWNSIVAWCGSIFWSTNTLYEGIIILGALVLAGILYPLANRKLNLLIEKTHFPGAVDDTINNLRRLIYPTFALIFIAISSQIAAAEAIAIDTAITTIIMKLLMAWIIIRIAVQFIGNPAMRNFFAFVTWTMAALSIFGLLDQTMTTLDAVGFNIGDNRLSLLSVTKSLILIVGLLYFALFLSGFTERRLKKIKSMTRTTQVLITKVTRVALIVFALLFGLTAAGIDLSLFAVFGGAIGLGIGFGLQKGISNLFSGMLLLLDRSIKPGDVIEIPDIGTFGWVNNMAARYTEIVTRDNKSFLIPNEDFITQRVINWSHGNSLVRIQVGFGVHYNSDPEEVIAIAKEAAKVPDRTVDNPEPVCWITEFGDSSVNFTLRFWIRDAENGVTNIKGEVLLELWKAFKEHKIDIPYPHREVYVHEVNS